MRKSSILFIGLILPFSLLAQEVIEIDKEDLVITEEKGTVVKALSTAEPQVLILNNQNQEVDQRATHDQNQRVGQRAIYDESAHISQQPVVRVFGAPVSTSYAVELKKSRHEAETQTEQKIVEKLESSRLRDEQERLKKLFNGGIVASNTSTTPKTSSQTVIVEDGKAVDNSEVYAEVVSPVQEKSEDSIYVGIHGGQASNLTRSLKNVNSYGSFGVSFGSYDDSGLILESSFFYSKHEINKNYTDRYKNNTNNYLGSHLTDVHQLAGSLSLKYTPFSSRFKPYAGVAISYNYWIYSANVDSAYACNGVNFRYCSNQVKADSIDLGANFGVDFKLNPKASIGFNMLVNILNLYNNRPDRKHDYRYDNRYDSRYYDEYRTYTFNPVKLEETNWIIASINAKLYF